MRTILSCILSIALVLTSTPIAYAGESVSSYSSSEGISTHDGCVLTNRAGSTTDAQDRAAGTILETTSQTSASCTVCDFISTVNSDGLLGSPGLSTHLSLSSLAASSSGAASVIATVSDSIVDSLAGLPIVSLFIPALAWADDGEGEEVTEEDNEEVLDDALSDVVFGYSADSSTSSDSSSSDLQEEVESYDTTEYGLSTLSGIEPLTSSSSTSISIEYVVGYLLFSFINTFLDLGYATFEDWLYGVLGIEVIDYSEEIYNFLYIYTYSQLGNIVYYTRYLSTYLPSIEEWTYQAQYDLFYGLFETTWNSSYGGYRPYLYLIYNLLSEYLDPIHINVLGIYELLYRYSDELTTIRQNSAYLTSLGSFGTLLSNTSTTNSYLANLYSLTSTISGNLLTISQLLQSDDFLSGISGSAWTDDDVTSVLNYLFRIYDNTDAYLSAMYMYLYQIRQSSYDIYNELVTVRQNSAYLASLSSFGNLLSLISITNSYLSYLYSLTSTISSNLLTISLLLQSDDFLSGISGSVWTDDDVVSVLSYLYNIDGLLDLMSTIQSNILYAIDDLEVNVTVEVDESSFSIWDFLIGAIETALIISAINDLADEAEDTFPIGALLMIIAALAVLNTDPVAPVYSGEIYGVTVEIDLSPYDNMALLCRLMLFVLYVIGLYKSTKDWAFPMDGD